MSTPTDSPSIVDSECRARRFASAIIVSYGCLFCWPILLGGFPYPTHDGEIHEVWYSQFAAQFWRGNLYPRWLQDMNGGLGSPAFFYYPPLPYHLTSLLHPLLPHADYHWRQLGVSAAIALLASGFAFHAWLRHHVPDWAAAWAAVLYMGLPYHLAVDLYSRGAFAEFWAFVWMPLILLCVDQAARGGRRKVLGLALTYAALVLTHLPTTVIFSAVPVLYGWRVAPADRRGTGLGRVLAGLLLGCGLAAVYWVPALSCQEYVHMEILRQGHGDYRQAFFFPHGAGLVARDHFGWGLFWILTSTLGLAACGWTLARNAARLRSDPAGVHFWFGGAWVAVLLMFPLSQPIYRLFPPLQWIQFPWRCLSLLALATAALTAFGLGTLRPPLSRLRWIVLILCLLVLAGWSVVSANLIFRSTRPPKPGASTVTALTERKRWNWCAPEYRPRWAQQELATTLADLEAGPGRPARTRILAGEGRAEVQRWEPRRITLDISARTGLRLCLGRLYFPGWTAVSSSHGSLPVTPAVPSGLIHLQLPAGRTRVELCLTRLWPERIGFWLSGLTAGVGLLLAAFASRRSAKAGLPSRLVPP